MYITDCIAYMDARLSVNTCEELPRLSIKLPNDTEIALTLSRKQLETMLESGEWWIIKNSEPEK